MRIYAFVCPNPECRKNIREPILVNDLSKTPEEQYCACPHCFIKLKAHTWARAHENHRDEAIEEHLNDSLFGRDATNEHMRNALDILAPNHRFRRS